MTPELSTAESVTTATNLPARFNVLLDATVPGDCPPRLNDPILRATLYLTRSVVLPVPDSVAPRTQAFGDYRVEPASHYGLLPGDGLRVDCRTLRGVGAVPLR